MTSTAPMTADEARASAEAWLAQGRPSPGAMAHADAVAACDPTPRPPSCGASSVPAPADPPGHSHRVPPVAVEVIGEAHVLAALDAMAGALDRMRVRTVTRGRYVSAVAYDVDDYVSGPR